MWRWWELRGIATEIAQTKDPSRCHFVKKPWRIDTTVTGTGQKCPSSFVPLVRTNPMDSRELENVVEPSVQEDETGVVNIQTDFCHICCLALLVLTVNNQTIFCFSHLLGARNSWVTSFSGYCLLSTSCKRSLSWNPWVPAGLCIDFGGSMNSLKICLCVHFSAERTHSI